MSAFDLIVSTCRPTRGAIAVVPVKLHNQIVSTAFSILRPRKDVNPFYLHYALRLPSTLEQFRKWSTGSSYPAILDSDVKKTVIPVPDADTQDAIAAKIVAALREHGKVLHEANAVWTNILHEITTTICGEEPNGAHDFAEYTDDQLDVYSLHEIHAKLESLPPLTTDNSNDAAGLLDLTNGGSAEPGDDQQ